MQIAMSIAGFDPSAGAGVLRDIITFRKIGVYGVGVVTSITFQNTKGVYGYKTLPSDYVSREIDKLMEDAKIKFAKIGMVGSDKIASMLKEKIEDYQLNVVIDPILESKNSYPLIDDKKSIENLLKASFVITPNVREAEILSGVKIKKEEDIVRAGKTLREKLGVIVIIKGGHFRGVDYLINDVVHRINIGFLGKEVHGTGCAYSSSLTAYLALGYDVYESFKRTRAFIQEEIKNSVKIGEGWEVLP